MVTPFFVCVLRRRASGSTDAEEPRDGNGRDKSGKKTQKEKGGREAREDGH